MFAFYAHSSDLHTLFYPMPIHRYIHTTVYRGLFARHHTPQSIVGKFYSQTFSQTPHLTTVWLGLACVQICMLCIYIYIYIYMVYRGLFARLNSPEPTATNPCLFRQTPHTTICHRVARLVAFGPPRAL